MNSSSTNDSASPCSARSGSSGARTIRRRPSSGYARAGVVTEEMS